jgi:hypothetical protein
LGKSGEEEVESEKEKGKRKCAKLNDSFVD